MALRTIVTTIDDVDGSAGAETVVFSCKETVYSVDLTARNQQELLRALEPFIIAGTVLSRPPAHTPASTGVMVRTRSGQVGGSRLGMIR